MIVYYCIPRMNLHRGYHSHFITWQVISKYSYHAYWIDIVLLIDLHVGESIAGKQDELSIIQSYMYVDQKNCTCIYYGQYIKNIG